MSEYGYLKNKEPQYSFDIAKQLIYDCAIELYYNRENTSNKSIAEKLLCILNEMDKMNANSDHKS